MKDDVQIRERPPKKRKHLAQALDIELATWENDPKLAPSERRKAREERDRRKDSVEQKTLLLCRASEGLTPAQREVAKGWRESQRTHIWKFWGGVGAYQEYVKGADIVVACPKEMTPPVRALGNSVWAAIHYARHRGLEVHVIMPDGKELT